MSDDDPVRELAHDHSDLNRQVLELGGAIAGRHTPVGTSVIDLLTELREQMFLHFAREEEGLFPFVTEEVPDLADRVNAMAVAHDTICGALARMVHMAETEAKPTALASVFERFETAYAEHASTEAELLRSLGQRLDADQRSRLAALVRGL